MKPLDYLHLQMALEGKGVSLENILIPAPPVTDTFPLILLGQTADGQKVVYFNELLPRNLREQIVTLAPKDLFASVMTLYPVLKANGIQPQTGHYRTYIFPEVETIPQEVQRLAPNDAGLKTFGFSGFANPVYVMERDGKVVSACVSVRQNAQCAESWVMTAPEHRGQGLAAQVVTAWAYEARQQGLVPFYSHALENTASARVASKLGLIPVFEEISIDDMSDSNS